MFGVGRHPPHRAPSCDDHKLVVALRQCGREDPAGENSPNFHDKTRMNDAKTAAAPGLGLHDDLQPRSPTCPEAIESVLAQETAFDVELVLSDDCSTDGTGAICRDYAARYPDRIRLVTCGAENVGWRANYRRTFEACRGKYVAYLRRRRLVVRSPEAAETGRRAGGRSTPTAECAIRQRNASGPRRTARNPTIRPTIPISTTCLLPDDLQLHDRGAPRA